MLHLVLAVATAGPCDDDAAGEACVAQALELSLAGGDEASKALESACDAGSTVACSHRGIHTLVLGKPLAFDVDPVAHTQLADACREGTGAACLHLAVLHEKGPSGWRDMSQSQMYLRQACGAGEPRGCHAHATAYAAGGSTKGIEQATTIFRDTCYDLDHALSCLELGRLLESTDTAGAKAARDEACTLDAGLCAK